MPISVNTTNQFDLTPQDQQFVELINNRINGYGTIPYSVPRQLIIDVIKQSARTFFRWGYFRCQEHRMLRLTKASLDEWAKKSNLWYQGIQYMGIGIQLPSFVNVVKEAYFTNDPLSAGLPDNTIDSITYMQSNAYGNSLMGINNHLYYYEAAAKMVEANVTRSVFGRSVMFHYSPSTHILIFYEDKFEGSVILDCQVNTKIEVLYNDDLFIRHVLAETKKELKRIIGGHTIQLPGDATLNADEICNNIEDSQIVEDILKNASGVGDVILQN